MYITGEQAQALMHFGVPGMKWGVRRSIGKLAREHAVLGLEKKSNDKALKTITSKLKRREEIGESSPRLKKMKRNLERSNRIIENSMKKNYSSLSKDDIAQGKRSLIKRTVLAGFLVGPIGATIALAAPMARAHRKT